MLPNPITQVGHTHVCWIAVSLYLFIYFIVFIFLHGWPKKNNTLRINSCGSHGNNRNIIKGLSLMYTAFFYLGYSKCSTLFPHSSTDWYEVGVRYLAPGSDYARFHVFCKTRCTYCEGFCRLKYGCLYICFELTFWLFCTSTCDLFEGLKPQMLFFVRSSILLDCDF